MRIDLLSANDPRTTAAAPLRSMWRVGAILEAIAVRDVDTGQLWLQLDKQRLPARLASGHSNGPLDGEHLRLRVLRDTPVLALESVEETSTERSTETALRRYLPRQSSPTPLLANLSWLMRHPDQVRNLQGVVQQALATLWHGLPEAADLQDSAQLTQALQRSGTFLEAQIAKQVTAQPPAVTQALSHDFKAGLLGLRECLRNFRLDPGSRQQPSGPMPSLHGPLSAINTGPASLSVVEGAAAQLGELKQQVEGSLARINTNQLLNAEAAQQGLSSWLIELPIRQEERAELLRFKFEREPNSQAGGESNWTVAVAMDLGAQGALHAQISLFGKRLNVQLRCESTALLSALDQQLETLKDALRMQGLELDRVVCLHGQPVDHVGTRLTRLLDLHA